jgi:serine/threonine protein kinase
MCSTHFVDEQFVHELHILSRLDHVHIVKIVAVCRPSSSLIMEYLDGGDLNNYLCSDCNNTVRLGQHFRQIDELCDSDKTQLTYMVQIAMAMAYMESHKCVHRDLATRNILVDTQRTHIKVADFGMARTLYSADYYRVDGRCSQPIRWMSVEALLFVGPPAVRAHTPCTGQTVARVRRVGVRCVRVGDCHALSTPAVRGVHRRASDRKSQAHASLRRVEG